LESEAVRQQRIDDRILALEDDKRSYESGGTNQTANTQATIQRLQMQINGLKAQRHRSSDAPQRVPAWISVALGSAYFRTDAMADAEREFGEALKVEPKLGEAHNNLALVFMVSGRYREADREVKAAESAGFKVNPQFKEDLKKALAGK
jgi:Tfp pilus assembly protein PilF